MLYSDRIYTDIKLNENGNEKWVDDDMAASTQKEFTCSDKMNASLLQQIIDSCKACNKMYEKLVQEDKKDILTYAETMKDKIKNYPFSSIDNLSIEEKY